ncbi:hypothetical protein B0H16DRAFT_1445870 [Mycena metata]|uniref:Uncharacterized protein n=1 Tax=Mycena metata TaxID=1033252 RepID=A0AAD7KHK8_9AGAR|nr:hypothetical protein B0H16DRAFT_1445870 [Mycena metata]
MSEKRSRSLSPNSEDSGVRRVFKRTVQAIRRSLSPPLPLPKLKKLKRKFVGSDSEPETNDRPDPPPAPQRPEGGRPAHTERGARTDAAPPAKLTGLVAPQTPPKRKKKKRAKREDLPQNFLSPQSGRIAAFTTQKPIHFAFESPPKPEKKPGKPTEGSRKLGINQTTRRSEDGWVSAGACLTVEAYKRFDSWKNDYQPKHYYYGKSIKLIHLGNPCDREQDIRARQWILAWDTPDRNQPPDLVNKRVPVFKVVYHCSGHCRHGKDSDDDSAPPPAEDDDGEAPDVDADGYADVDSDSSLSESTGKSKAKPDLQSLSVSELNDRLDTGSARKMKAPAKMLKSMQAEVYSDDLSKLYFFQQHQHPETLTQYLESSHYIRQCTLEMARTLGLSAASIKRRLLHLFDEDKTPSYRRPNATQVNNIVNNARRKERLLSDPLLSIGAFAELNPDKVFRYTEPNYETDPPRQFSTGIHHPYGTQAMLLGAWEHGVGLDSTYRHMNENRAPLTIMITLDEKGRMVPGIFTFMFSVVTLLLTDEILIGFAYLSSDTTVETQVTFLKETKKLVEKMALDLVDGRVEVAEGLKGHTDALMKQAHLVVKNGWKPAFFMIDKYRASKFAIRQERLYDFLRTVFPGIIIRICQFHVMQAILRWERDNAVVGEAQARPTLDIRRKHQLLWAVREIQRCRDPAQWQEYLDQFRQRLEWIAEGSRNSAQTLWDYFEANWFCDEWRELWTDMGLPADQNRDGMLSTNNWTERAFKTFNQVFLGNRNNKSIYRLVLILANEWFQYYQAWEPRKQLDTKIFKINAEGHRIWSCEGAVQSFVLENGNTAWRVARLN